MSQFRYGIPSSLWELRVKRSSDIQAHTKYIFKLKQLYSRLITLGFGSTVNDISKRGICHVALRILRSRLLVPKFRSPSRGFHERHTRRTIFLALT